MEAVHLYLGVAYLRANKIEKAKKILMKSKSKFPESKLFEYLEKEIAQREHK